MSARDSAPSRGWEERRTGPVELLWDLVFVFAITQVTALLADDLTWAGTGRGLLILALMWWAWSAFVWAANAQEARSATLRGALLLAMVLIFVAGLAVPSAFGDLATLFAVSYVGVRILHLVLYADASRRGNASWRAIAGFAATVLVGMALLVTGSFLSASAQTALWAVAVAIDYAGPAWLTREQLRGLQAVAVAHFAERYGLFVIICLGESLVAVGLGASGHEIDARLLAAAVAGVLITIGLWWTYFEGVAEAAESRLRTHEDPVLAAADSYSYLHLVIVTGIIVFAVGMKKALPADADPLDDAARLALYGGVATYLAGLAAFRVRLLGSAGREIVAVPVLLLLAVVALEVPAWAAVALAAVVVVGLCVLAFRPASAEAPLRAP